MDSRLEGLPSRIAYSFRHGTFDLPALCPHACFEADDGWSTAVRLGGHLPSLFRRFEHLGVVLASAQSGPVSLADTWERPSFQWVSSTGEFVELQTGAEIRLASLKTAMAVVQEVEDQQVASIQLFDAHGVGGLKLMMTNWSDLEFFEALITIHARAREEGPDRVPQPDFVGLETGGRKSPKVDVDRIRTLWPGLAKSMPDSEFPGIEGLSRLEALKQVGTDYAWPVKRESVLSAVESMATRGVTLGGAVRNGLAFLPAAFRPKHWNQCGCGQTFFGGSSQFTLRRCCSQWEAWAVRFSTASDEVVCLEFYDGQGNFCGGLGLGPSASLPDHVCWKQHTGRE